MEKNVLMNKKIIQRKFFGNKKDFKDFGLQLDLETETLGESW